MVNIHGFSAAFGREIERAHPIARFVNEADFEQRHIVQAAWELSRKHPEIRVFTHPQKRKKRCVPSCDAAASHFEDRVEGCPGCWAASKAPTVTEALGIKSNWDLVAVDQDGRTLAVEVKWVSLSAARAPNDTLHRFIGQCTLAAAANDLVIGVCGVSGRRDKGFDRHTDDLKAVLERIGVCLIVVPTDSHSVG